MRRRGFVPEAPGRLEGRELLSAAPGPVVLPGLRFNSALAGVRRDFESYATGGDLHKLKTSLAMTLKTIPFGKADGLGQAVDAILADMQQEINAGTPNAVVNAQKQVVRAVRQDVRAHIQAGDIVVRL